MFNRLMGALPRVAVLVALAIAPALLQAGSDIGDQARLEAVLLNGEKVNLEKWKGKVVMVSFWATWCPVCRSEMPHWQKFYEANRARGFEMIAMSVDDGVEEVRAFMAEKKYRFPVGWRFDKAEDDDFPTIRGTPTTFIVDRQGRVALKQVGRVSDEFLEQSVNNLLAR
jgi:cytochrome c biogenesis protein CcmG, thiol:disulfide interchange protein DsbE